MQLSACKLKLPDCYTERVVLSKRLEALSRSVQTSLYLAFGIREKAGKAECRTLIQEYGCRALDMLCSTTQIFDRLLSLTSNR